MKQVLQRCSSLLGTDDASWPSASDGEGQGGAVFRSFNPLHGVVHDTEGPAHKYVQSLGQPDIFVWKKYSNDDAIYLKVPGTVSPHLNVSKDFFYIMILMIYVL